MRDKPRQQQSPISCSRLLNCHVALLVHNLEDYEHKKKWWRFCQPVNAKEGWLKLVVGLEFTRLGSV